MTHLRHKPTLVEMEVNYIFFEMLRALKAALKKFRFFFLLLSRTHCKQIHSKLSSK